MKLIFPNPRGVGDIAAAIYCFENCGRQIGIKTELHGPIVNEICELFDLRYVKFSDNENRGILTKDFAYDGKRHLIERYRLFLEREYKYNHLKCISLNPKNKAITHGQYTAVQLDGRHAAKHKCGMSIDEMNKAVRKFAGRSPTVIGGLDTPRHVKNATYSLGNIAHSFQVLLGCSMFLGCDSGMSHLAGCIGKTSIVIPNFNTKGIKEYYKGYKNTIIVTKDSF